MFTSALDNYESSFVYKLFSPTELYSLIPTGKACEGATISFSKTPLQNEPKGVEILSPNTGYYDRSNRLLLQVDEATSNGSKEYTVRSRGSGWCIDDGTPLSFFYPYWAASLNLENVKVNAQLGARLYKLFSAAHPYVHLPSGLRIDGNKELFSALNPTTVYTTCARDIGNFKDCEEFGNIMSIYGEPMSLIDFDAILLTGRLIPYDMRARKGESFSKDVSELSYSSRVPFMIKPKAELIDDTAFYKTLTSFKHSVLWSH